MKGSMFHTNTFSNVCVGVAPLAAPSTLTARVHQTPAGSHSIPPHPSVLPA